MTQILMYNTRPPRRSKAECRKAHNDRFNQAAREAGIIGQPRPKMSEEEKKEKQRARNKAYRNKVKEARKKERKGLWTMHDFSGKRVKDEQLSLYPTLETLRRKVYDITDNTTI